MQVHFFMTTDRGLFSEEMGRELRILHVCGAPMSAFSELLDRIEYLPAPPEKQRRGAEKLREYRVQACMTAHDA